MIDEGHDYHDDDDDDEDEGDDDDDDDFLQTSYGRYGCLHDYHVLFSSREQWRETSCANASTAHALWEDTGSTLGIGRADRTPVSQTVDLVRWGRF